VDARDDQRGNRDRTDLGASPMLRASNPLAAGWVGMAGAMFVLHFGTFHWIALFWRSRGVDAAPIMRRPIRSTSLAEFWGRRWNAGFHALASRFTFTPLRSRVSVAGATLFAFLVSGLIHELVISVPVRSGYGLPTAYFLLQGAAVLFERSPLGRGIGLARGWRGWVFTLTVTAGPAFWLFPPPFVRLVTLPMLDVMGAGTIHQEFVMRIDLIVLLRIAGLMHLGLICAGVMMPRVVDMRTHLATLPPFLRQLFWVYYAFIGLCLIGFSTITIVFADALAHGGTLARALCVFLAIFWALRLYVATFVFDLRPYLTSRPRRLGYAATNVVFAFLPVVYLLAAIMPAV
jgi:hypothetical protein